MGALGPSAPGREAGVDRLLEAALQERLGGGEGDGAAGLTPGLTAGGSGDRVEEELARTRS